MARRHDEETAFGSDSFLDVVANIVGILIILIVIVGVRVSRTPAVTAKDSSATEVTPAAELPLLSIQVPAEEPLPEPEKTPLPSMPSFPPLPDLEAPADLIAAVEALEKQHASSTEESKQLAEKLKRLAMESDDQRHRNTLFEKELDSQQVHYRAVASRKVLLESELIQKREAMTATEKQLEEFGNRDEPVETLTHQLLPIGREVDGDEVHFRLYQGRVSCVPIPELAKEVRREMERRKDIMLTRSSFQGSTREIDGYVLDFVMQRQGMSLAEELRYGRAVMRIVASAWIIHPTEQLQTETL